MLQADRHKNQIAIFLKNSYLFVAIYSHGLGATPYTPHARTHIKAHCIHTSAVHVRQSASHTGQSTYTAR